MSSGSIVRITKWCGKVGLFCGAVYAVTASGLWSSDENRSSMKALQDLGQRANQKIGGDYFSGVAIPDFDIANKWNNGVSRTIDYAADLPGNAVDKFKNGLEYVHDKLK